MSTTAISTDAPNTTMVSTIKSIATSSSSFSTMPSTTTSATIVQAPRPQYDATNQSMIPSLNYLNHQYGSIKNRTYKDNFQSMIISHGPAAKPSHSISPPPTVQNHNNQSNPSPIIPYTHSNASSIIPYTQTNIYKSMDSTDHHSQQISSPPYMLPIQNLMRNQPTTIQKPLHCEQYLDLAARSSSELIAARSILDTQVLPSMQTEAVQRKDYLGNVTNENHSSYPQQQQHQQHAFHRTITNEEFATETEHIVDELNEMLKTTMAMHAQQMTRDFRYTDSPQANLLPRREPIYSNLGEFNAFNSKSLK